MSIGYLLLTAARWAVRLWALWFVPRRRSPNAARAWLLLILLEPFGGAILYSIFGRAYLPRVRRERQKEASGIIRSTPAVAWLPTEVDVRPELRSTASLAQQLGDFPVVGGNRAEILDDYQGFLDRLVEDVDRARTSVHLLFYIFEPDATGTRVADALVRAAGRGVRCRLMADGLASAPALRRLAPRLREAGVEFLSLLPPGMRGARRDLRNHRKIAVVDGLVAYTGSQNLVDAYDYKGRGLTYEDLMVRLTGPVVRQLQAIFLTDRFMETGERFAEESHFPPVGAAGDVLAQALPSGPTYRVENNQRTFVQLLYGARERVVVTSPYFVPDEPFLEAMQAAASRGLDVRLITPRQPDQMLVRLAQESFYEGLLRAGVKIHLYRPRFLHAKHISVDDDFAAIGSSNIDLRSFTLNEEAMVFLYDRDTCAALARVQERYVRDSDRLTRERWDARPRHRQAAQRLARMVDSLL
jgi:cardiolipin synthase